MGERDTAIVTTVQAATLVAPYQLEVRGYPYPEVLEPGAVLLRMRASGICGTDKHTFRGEVDQYPGSDRGRGATYPLIQGHENVGVVEAIGDGGAYAGDGTLLEIGDRVVPHPTAPAARAGRASAASPTSSAGTSTATATRSPPTSRRTCSAAGRSACTSSRAPASSGCRTRCPTTWPR